MLACFKWAAPFLAVAAAALGLCHVCHLGSPQLIEVQALHRGAVDVHSTTCRLPVLAVEVWVKFRAGEALYAAGCLFESGMPQT